MKRNNDVSTTMAPLPAKQEVDRHEDHNDLWGGKTRFVCRQKVVSKSLNCTILGIIVKYYLSNMSKHKKKKRNIVSSELESHNLDYITVRAYCYRDKMLDEYMK